MRNAANTIADGGRQGPGRRLRRHGRDDRLEHARGKLRGRAPSSAPARATAKVLGIKEFEDAVAQARFNDLSHWGYGTSWGVLRGLLGATGHAGHDRHRGCTAPPIYGELPR